MASAICIASGGTCLRFPSPVNHRIYAERQGADYRLEVGSSGQLRNRYYFKLQVLLTLLPRYEWVVWIDDDAYFTRLDVDLRALCRTHATGPFLALADGRVHPTGGWSRINSGVLLVRNCPEALAFLQLCLDTEIDVVRTWWIPEEHGMATDSDQDTLLYHILHRQDRGPLNAALSPALLPRDSTRNSHSPADAGRAGRRPNFTQETPPQAAGNISAFKIVPHLELNAREYHYLSRLDEHFICHFPGLPDKLGTIRRFGARFGTGLTLVPPAILREHGFEEDVGEDFVPLPRPGLLGRVKRRFRSLFVG